jgi:hypothetical protein
MFRLEELFGQQVEIYRDLRRGHDCWSIRSPKSPKRVLNYEGTGPDRVKVRTQVAALRDCTFKVYEAGRQRTLRERQKNVHAWVVGVLVDPAQVRRHCTEDVTYDAFKFTSFVLADKPAVPVFSAAMCLFEYPKVKIPQSGEGIEDVGLHQARLLQRRLRPAGERRARPAGRS